jgi:argininosuccinate lyase
MLPQKRNPFLMEYIKGRSSVPAGCYATAVGALTKTPYTNSFEVSSQLDHAIVESAKALEDILTVARYLVEGVQVDARRVVDHLRIHAVTATAITEKLVVERQMSFRAAHTKVGDTVRARRERDESVHEALVELDESFMALRPIEWALSHRMGGGPGAVGEPGDLVGTYRSLAEDTRAFESFYSIWKDAAAMRRDIVAQVITR